jgi:hypothetical protein
MDCTLKIIAGPDAGQEFACGAAENYLGRSQRCVVRLSGQSVSFEHALITRAGDDFFIENLSANGTVLNNERLGGKTRLRVKDQLRLGAETVIRVENVPQSAAAGSSRRILLAAVVGMALLAVALVMSDTFSSGSGGDWKGAYRALLTFAQEQVVTNQLPQDVPGTMEAAWAMQNAGDRSGAKKKWAEVHVYLDDWERSAGLTGGRTSTRGLDALLSGKGKTVGPDDMRAALKQFVIEMERRR